MPVKPRILVVAGTRPETIKMALVIRLVEEDPGLDLVFVHSGQHYDYELSRQLIEELELPSPDVNLRVGSGPTPSKHHACYLDMNGSSRSIAPM